MELTAEIARELLYYDIKTGDLFWKERDVKWFPRKANSAAWNSRFAGKKTLTSAHPRGYKTGMILGKRYLTHRIIWLISYGDWPKYQIDHINGDRTDNRLCNLRDLDQKNNCRNMGLRATNTSGITGVRWSESANKWRAAIMVNYKSISLGCYDELAESAKARKEAEIKYGFHENHGTERKQYTNT